MKLKYKLGCYERNEITFEELKNEFEDLLCAAYLDFVDIRKEFIKKLFFYSEMKNYLGLEKAHDLYVEKMGGLFDKYFNSEELENKVKEQK